MVRVLKERTYIRMLLRITGINFYITLTLPDIGRTALGRSVKCHVEAI
jgi:hypothetical protein